MSVLQSERGESGMEFVHTARELRIHTIRKCSHFPKKYTFYVGVPMVEAATNVHNKVKMANSIFPENQHEAQMRKDLLVEARCSLQSLISQLEIAKELFPIENDAFIYWSNLISKELRLVNAVIRNDKGRFENLP